MERRATPGVFGLWLFRFGLVVRSGFGRGKGRVGGVRGGLLFEYEFIEPFVYRRRRYGYMGSMSINRVCLRTQSKYNHYKKGCDTVEVTVSE